MIAASRGSPIVTNIIGAVVPILLIAGYIYRRRLVRSSSLMDISPADGFDPGWRPVVVHSMKLFPQRGSADPLTIMRTIHLQLELALLIMLVPLSFVTPWNGGAVGPAPWVMTGVGILSLIGIARVRRRPLDAAGEAGLAGQFRTAMFLGIGFAEIPGIIGIAAALITKSLWIYVVGLSFSMLGLTLVAPRRSEIARRQRQIVEAHSALDLTRALLRPPDRPGNA